jgi:hypothetical protein
MSGPKILGLLVMMTLTMFLSLPGYAWDVEVQSVGIRGGINLEHVAIPPSEKEDFYQVDVVMYLALPWSWQYPSGWEMSWTFNGAAGFLRGGGDTAGVVELGPGITFYKPSWRMMIDLGTGLTALTRSHFGDQDMGGPVQIMGQGGVSFDLGWNLFAGWRFHHISDATLYGSHSKGVDINFLELRYHF